MNVIVTGASKGIGKALAFRFADEGFNVAICARNEAALQEVRAGIKERQPQVEVLLKACDLSQAAGVAAFANMVRPAWQRIDVLINNAGMFVPGQIKEEEAGTLEKMIDTNLYSAYRLTRSLLPVMIEARSGHIFNMCSVASIKAYPNGGSYAISKHALLGFSRCLREELHEHNIRVSAVLPGATYTPSWEASGLPQERFLPAGDVAETIYRAWKLSGRTVLEEVVLRPLEGDI